MSRGREILDGGRVPLHEALAGGVAQDRALAAGALGQQNAQTGQTGRVELVELHVLQRKSLAEHDAHPVAGQRVGVRRGLEHLAGAAGGEDDRLGVEDVDLAGGQFVGNRAGAYGTVIGLRHHDVEDVELVEELDALLDAVLVQGLQDHVAGAVGGVAGPADGGLAVIAGMAAEATLVDAALGRAVERQAHLLQIEHRVDGFLAHDLGGVLVDQVVAALDGVEGVPFPVVVLDIGQRGAHAALGRAGVRARRVELGQHGRAGALGRFDGGAHSGPAGTHDHYVVSVELHNAPYQPVMVGSKVKITKVPTPSVSRTEAASSTVQPEPGAGLARVVVDDGAQSVGAVDLCQPEHGQVPDLPERRRPSSGDEAPVDPVHAAVQHVHDQQVTEHQDDQHDAGQPHEQPRIHLEVGPAAGDALLRRPRRLDATSGRRIVGGGHDASPR